MKHLLTLFAVVTILMTASCSSLIVKTVDVYPEAHVIAERQSELTAAVVASSEPAPSAQLPSTQEEPTAPVVEAAPFPVLEEAYAAVVAVDPTEPLPEAVHFTERDVQCMATAIYHEARGESRTGQAAVGYVITNRVKHGGFRNTVCGVVYQRDGRLCQFSWYCDGKSDVPTDRASYEAVQALARLVLMRQIKNPIGKAVFFDGYGRKARKPGVYQIGAHRFYERYALR